MEIRQIKPEERAAYGRLCSLCFTYPYRDESAAVEAETEREQRQYRGAFDEQGRLCSGMIQLDMVCHFSGQEVKMLGIGGVVSHPGHRNCGGIRALFEEGLPRARQEGYVFSALYPFSHVYYRKFGYELAQVTREATFNPRDLRADLRRAACTELILPEDEAGREAVRQVYEAYARGRNLSVHRDAARWERKWGGTPWEQLKYLYLFRDAQNEPMAWWVGEIEPNGQRGQLHLLDMAWTKPEGLEAIFAMLRGGNEYKQVRMAVPEDLELRFLLGEPHELQERTYCNGMARVLDVRRALALLPAPVLPGNFTVRVSDGQIPENNGVFRVTGDGIELRVEEAGQDDPDVETDIGGLTLLVLGKMSLAEFMMLNRGRVRRTTPFMEALLIRRSTFLYDSF